MVEFPQSSTMPATIKTEQSGQTSAFTPDGKLVMNYGLPYVAWGFTVDKLEDWLTTLEELIVTIPPSHRYSLESLYFSLKAAHQRHLLEHEEVVTNAPNGDDLMQYLASYSAAMAWELLEGKK